LKYDVKKKNDLKLVVIVAACVVLASVIGSTIAVNVYGVPAHYVWTIVTWITNPVGQLVRHLLVG
jgi:hypothetical protein